MHDLICSSQEPYEGDSIVIPPWAGPGLLAWKGGRLRDVGQPPPSVGMKAERKAVVGKVVGGRTGTKGRELLCARKDPLSLWDMLFWKVKGRQPHYPSGMSEEGLRH